jgi:ATP adenylyltransferase
MRFERLWTPWRMEYVGKAGGGGDACIFCDALAAGDDEARHIVHRTDTTFVMLNAFPYNTGHVMVASTRHVAELSDLDPAERADLMETTSRTIEVIRKAMDPDGFNTGMNLGKVAGAGIPGHLHIHIVPRWTGDTNFMPVTADTKVLPELLQDTAAKLRSAF